METEQNESRFDAEHGDILQRYGSQMGRPLMEMHGITVVPASAELDNGNFWRQLHSATRQKGLGEKPWGIIYVVNNSIAAAECSVTEDPNPTTDDGDISWFEGNNLQVALERYEENQRHLTLLRLLMEGKALVAQGDDPHVVTQQIAEQSNNIPLTENTMAIVRQYLESNAYVYGIDASSEGLAIDTNTQNIVGRARNIGGHMAYDWLHGNGWIDFLDADCWVPGRKYVSSMNNAFSDPDVSVVLKPLQPKVVEFSGLLTDYSTDIQVIGLLDYLTTSMLAHNSQYDLSRALNEENWNRFGKIGGPQCAVSASLFRSLGGHTQDILEPYEDFVFNKMAIEAGLPRYLRGGCDQIYNSTRGRPGSTDRAGANSEFISQGGYGGRDILKMRRSNDKLSAFHLNRLLKKSSSLAQQHEEYPSVRARFFKAECIKRTYFLQWAHSIVEHLAGNLSTMRPQDRDFLNAHPMLPAMIQEILEMIRYDNGIRKAMSNDTPDKVMSLPPEQQVWKFLEEFLPEYFGKPPMNEPNYDLKINPYEETPGLNYRDYKHLVDANYAVSAQHANSEARPSLGAAYKRHPHRHRHDADHGAL